jgi:hypothetical protein
MGRPPYARGIETAQDDAGEIAGDERRDAGLNAQALDRIADNAVKPIDDGSNWGLIDDALNGIERRCEQGICCGRDVVDDGRERVNNRLKDVRQRLRRPVGRCGNSRTVDDIVTGADDGTDGVPGGGRDATDDPPQYIGQLARLLCPGRRCPMVAQETSPLAIQKDRAATRRKGTRITTPHVTPSSMQSTKLDAGNRGRR